MLNTLRPRQHGHHFAEDTLKRIFMNENVIISIKISLKFVPKGPIKNFPAMIQIMAWRCPGDKPLSEPMMVSLPTHICVASKGYCMHSLLLEIKSHGKTSNRLSHRKHWWNSFQSGPVVFLMMSKYLLCTKKLEKSIQIHNVEMEKRIEVIM